MVFENSGHSPQIEEGELFQSTCATSWTGRARECHDVPTLLDAARRRPEVPYVDVRGAADGPHLTVLAGVHGTEYTSIAAVREFAATLDPSEVRGRVTAVPVVNLDGLLGALAVRRARRTARTSTAASRATRAARPPRCSPTPLFAGAGRRLRRAARPARRRPARGARAVRALRGVAGRGRRARRWRWPYGLGHVVRQRCRQRTVAGSTCAAAADVGIPAIIAESGQNGLLDRRVGRAAPRRAGTTSRGPSACCRARWCTARRRRSTRAGTGCGRRWPAGGSRRVAGRRAGRGGRTCSARSASCWATSCTRSAPPRPGCRCSSPPARRCSRRRAAAGAGSQLRPWCSPPPAPIFVPLSSTRRGGRRRDEDRGTGRVRSGDAHPHALDAVDERRHQPVRLADDLEIRACSSNSTRKATATSRRARCAPRQKCGPGRAEAEVRVGVAADVEARPGP